MSRKTDPDKNAGFMTDAAETKLAEAASAVSHSLNQLAQIEKAMHPPMHLPHPQNPARLGMANLASVDWTGPVEPLLRKLAKATHYRLRVLGNTPAIPVIVNVTKHDVPMADILRDLTYQTAKRADILLYPRSKVMELRYHS